jgi:hypothetical protein
MKCADSETSERRSLNDINGLRPNISLKGIRIKDTFIVWPMADI